MWASALRTPRSDIFQVGANQRGIIAGANRFPKRRFDFPVTRIPHADSVLLSRLKAKKNARCSLSSRCGSRSDSRERLSGVSCRTRNCDGLWRAETRIGGEECGGEPMYISCLVTDYDGALAHDCVVDDATADALVTFRRSSRRLLLVTGRELPDLVRVFPRIDLFDRVVAENGALLFDPATKKETPLGPEPSAELVETLRKKGVSSLSVGRSIVATWEPNEKLVLDAIRQHPQTAGAELDHLHADGRRRGRRHLAPPSADERLFALGS